MQLILAALCLLSPAPSKAQEPQAPLLLDFSRIPPSAVELIGSTSHRMVPEAEAPGGWSFDEGILTASPGWDSVVTPSPYGDFRMHVEFSVNEADSGGRETHGNSGVYIQQRYELQILDSFNVAPSDYQSWDLGSIYRLKKPDQLAALPTGAWQSYDIIFRAARFDGDRKAEDARVTVFLNDRLIHEDVPLTRKTGAGKPEGPNALPVKLQGHHNQVRFRRTWIESLDLAAIPPVSAKDPRRLQKVLPRPGKVFTLEGRTAFVIEPAAASRGIGPLPWVWYAPTLRGLPGPEEGWMIDRLLAKGIAVAGIDVGESYGSPAGVEGYNSLYEHLTTVRGFGDRPALLGRSRGGLMLYSWAVNNPERVAGIGGVYPVCDLTSFPGVEAAAPAYGLEPDELRASLTTLNPIHRLDVLAEARVPIHHVHGDSDGVVPLDANSGELARRYEELGGTVELSVVRGRGHDMWSGWFQSEGLTDFMVRSALAPTEVRFLSANVRYGTAKDGEHAWQNRAALTIETLVAAEPDILGLQEALSFQVEAIKEAFPDHTVLGEGRDGLRKGEWCALLVDSRRFTVRASGTFRLSPTDEVGAMGWDAACTRIATWAELTERSSPDRPFVVLNTHFDHKGKEARRMSAKMIAEWLLARRDASGELPVILMGDLNAEPASPPLATLKEAGYRDTFGTIHPLAADSGTFHGFKGGRNGRRIDYVLANAGWHIDRAWIDWAETESLFPSDHRFVGATLRQVH